MDDVFDDDCISEEKNSDLSREWKARQSQFKSLGFRDGFLAGKEDSSQQGFNEGFVQSAQSSLLLGQARGAASAFSCLPSHIQTFIATDEGRTKLVLLNEQLRRISTESAAAMYHDDAIALKSVKCCNGSTNCTGQRCNTQAEGAASISELGTRLDTLVCQVDKIVPLKK